MPSHKKTQKRQTRNQYELNRPAEPPPFTARYSEPKNIAPEKKSKKKSKSKPVEPVVSNHKKTQQRQTRNQYELNRPPERPPFIAHYSEANKIAPEKKSKKKKRSKSNIHYKPVEPVVPPKVARPNPLEVKARAAARAAAAAAATATVAPKRKPPPLKPRGAKVRVEPPPEPPPAAVKRMMPKPKPRVRMTRKAYNTPVNMAEFMMAANKPMKKTIPKMSRKSPAFFNIPNATNVEGMKAAVTEVANSFTSRIPSGHILNPLLRETPNYPLLRGSFMTRKLMSKQVKGTKLNAIKE